MRLKFIFLFSVLTLLILSNLNSQGKKEFKIEVQCRINKQIYLVYQSINNELIKIPINKTFKTPKVIKDKIEEPVLARLIIDSTLDRQIYIEPKTMQLKITNVNNKILIKFNGSKTNEEMEEQEALLSKYRNGEFYFLQKFYYDSLFIQRNTQSFYSLVLFNFYFFDLNPQFSKNFFEKISNDLKQTPTGKKVLTKYNALIKILAIKNNTNFTLKDTIGIPISFNSILLGNKFYLIDFWASWCMPCRKEMVSVLKTYKSFSRKNLAVILISQDTNTNDWLNAIYVDNTNILHNFIDSDAICEKKFGIITIPTKILLDKDLNVIGVYSSKNIGKFKLEQKLEELL